MQRVLVYLAVAALLAALGCAAGPDPRDAALVELRERVARLERVQEVHAGELTVVAWEREEGER